MTSFRQLLQQHRAVSCALCSRHRFQGAWPLHLDPCSGRKGSDLSRSELGLVYTGGASIIDGGRGIPTKWYVRVLRVLRVLHVEFYSYYYYTQHCHYTTLHYTTMLPRYPPIQCKATIQLTKPIHYITFDGTITFFLYKTKFNQRVQAKHCL